MTEAITIALIVATPPTIIGVAQLISSLKNGTNIKGVHKSMNSRMDELLRLKGIASHAEGRQEAEAEAEAERKHG
jgi:hypothetical protein